MLCDVYIIHATFDGRKYSSLNSTLQGQCTGRHTTYLVSASALVLVSIWAHIQYYWTTLVSFWCHLVIERGHQ